MQQQKIISNEYYLDLGFLTPIEYTIYRLEANGEKFEDGLSTKDGLFVAGLHI